MAIPELIDKARKQFTEWKWWEKEKFSKAIMDNLPNLNESQSPTVSEVLSYEQWIAEWLRRAKEEVKWNDDWIKKAWAEWETPYNDEDYEWFKKSILKHLPSASISPSEVKVEEKCVHKRKANNNTIYKCSECEQLAEVC